MQNPSKDDRQVFSGAHTKQVGLNLVLAGDVANEVRVFIGGAGANIGFRFKGTILETRPPSTGILRCQNEEVAGLLI